MNSRFRRLEIGKLLELGVTSLFPELAVVALLPLTELERSGTQNASLLRWEGTRKGRTCSQTVVFSREEVHKRWGQIQKFDLNLSFSPFDGAMKFNGKKIPLPARKRFCPCGRILLAVLLKYCQAELHYHNGNPKALLDVALPLRCRKRRKLLITESCLPLASHTVMRLASTHLT